MTALHVLTECENSSMFVVVINDEIIIFWCKQLKIREAFLVTEFTVWYIFYNGPRAKLSNIKYETIFIDIYKAIRLCMDLLGNLNRADEFEKDRSRIDVLCDTNQW